MQFPVTIEIGPLKILLHTICETVAFLVGFRYFLYLRNKQGDQIEQSNRVWIIIAAIFGALIGSRLIGGLEDIAGLQNTDDKLAWFYQNKTVVGGFSGGLFGVEAAKKWIGEQKPSGDLFTYPMLLALIIGRTGCFSMGVYEATYGMPSSLPWAVDLGDGIARHPVSLYEIIFLLMLWLSLRITEKKIALAPGARFKIFIISYLFFRFILDFIKPHYSLFAGISTIQVTCLLVLIYYGRYILQPRRLVLSNA